MRESASPWEAGARPVRRPLLAEIQGFIRTHSAYLIAASVAAMVGGIALAVVGHWSQAAMVAIVGIVPLALVFFSGYEALLAACLPFVAIFLDYYQLYGLPLRIPIVTLALGGALLIALFLFQSETRPWRRVPLVGYWLALIALAALAIPRASMTQTLTYFLSVFMTPFVCYVVGTQVARSPRSVILVIAIISAIAVLIGMHTIYQGATGKFLFATPREIDYLGSKYGFYLAGTDFDRAGSFLQNPDSNGEYLAISFFPLIGLFLVTKRLWLRVLTAIGAAIVVIGLLFTFTSASWFAWGVGIVVLLWQAIPKRYLKRTLIGLGIMAVLFGGVFNSRLLALIRHATDPREIQFRVGDWETALRAIQAHPLTGIGMGYNIYIRTAEPYRVPWQTTPLAHPHNSYLELAAFAGIPVALAFLALWAVMLRTIVRRARLAPVSLRPVVGAILIELIVLSVNSVFINGWTLPPHAAITWLMIGLTIGYFPAASAVARKEPAGAVMTQSAPAEPLLTPGLRPSSL